jgi:hypothetical protein
VTAPRRERLLLLVAGIALGARLAHPGYGFNLLVYLVLLAAAVFLLLLPPRPRRPLTRRELAREVERYTEHERRKYGGGAGDG